MPVAPRGCRERGDGGRGAGGAAAAASLLCSRNGGGARLDAPCAEGGRRKGAVPGDVVELRPCREGRRRVQSGRPASHGGEAAAAGGGRGRGAERPSECDSARESIRVGARRRRRGKWARLCWSLGVLFTRALAGSLRFMSAYDFLRVKRC